MDNQQPGPDQFYGEWQCLRRHAAANPDTDEHTGYYTDADEYADRYADADLYPDQYPDSYTDPASWHAR
jgi:hypothetical protein